MLYVRNKDNVLHWVYFIFDNWYLLDLCFISLGYNARFVEIVHELSKQPSYMTKASFKEHVESRMSLI